MKYAKLLITAFILVFPSLACSTEVVYDEVPWPSTIECHHCAAINIAGITLRVPNKAIESISFIKLNELSLEISTNKGWLGLDNKFFVLLINEEQATGGLNKSGIYEDLSVGNVKQFFYALGKKNENTSALRLSRDVMGVLDSSNYVIISGKQYSAFWVASNDADNQSLYILPEGSENIYLIGGHLNSDIVQNLLASIFANK